MKYKVIYARKQVKRGESELYRNERVFDNLADAGKHYYRIIGALDRCEPSGRIEWQGADNAGETWYDYRDHADIVVSIEEVAE